MTQYDFGMSKHYNIASLRRTSLFCPSQWEGLTDDGREIYIRYRYGTLEMWIANKPGVRIDWQPDELIVEHSVGDEYAGALSCSQMRDGISILLERNITWPDICEGEIDQATLNEKVVSTWEHLSALISKGDIKVMAEQEIDKLDPKQNVFLTSDRQASEEYASRGFDVAATSAYDFISNDQEGDGPPTIFK